MITVYFVQHGLAESKDVDAARPLSNDGRKQVRKMASYLKGQNIVLNKVCHSGKLRALQTATLFAEILGNDVVEELGGMDPNADPQDLLQQMNEDAVMYVGHLPNMQNVVTTLVTGSNEQPVLKFQNAAVACVEISDGVGCINWFLTADMC